MGNKYSYIGAVGQINDMACWAASLKWWYMAVMSINASQTKLWERYKGLREPLGGMTDAGMKHIIGENGMALIEYPTASGCGLTEMKWMLSYGPVYLAYTESGTQKRHVNVVYGVNGNESYAEVLAMEPQAVDKGDGTWKGKHMKKPLNDFNLMGSIWAGVSRKAFNR